MDRIKALVASCSLLALGACAVTPQAPTVVAMPGPGKSFTAFQQEDAFCRQAAFASVGGVSANQAATQSAVGSAAVGTVVGAALGAAIGGAAGNPGLGAAAGAGAGLLTGSSVGAANAQAAGGDTQFRYDMTYAQCMFSYGNTVQQPQPTYRRGARLLGGARGRGGAARGGRRLGMGLGRWMGRWLAPARLVVAPIASPRRRGDAA